MTQQERTENNRLLAEFLGATETFQGAYEMYGVIPSIEDGLDEQHYFWPSEMPFDADWSWIMEVVIAIGNTEDVRYTNTGNCQVTISNEYVWVDPPIGDRIYFSGNSLKDRGKSLISKVYEGCVHFVKWYNENTNN